MKRYIRAWYVGEPSASEYGEFMTQRHKKMQDRYYPFKVKDAYLSRRSLNSSGYEISLPSGETWIAYRVGDVLSPKGYKLYGAYINPKIRSSFDLKDTDLATDKIFNNINSIISYLYETEDIEA
jgi:hypothetical protein